MKLWDRIKTAAMIVMTTEKKAQRQVSEILGDQATQDMITERLSSEFWANGQEPENQIALTNPYLDQDVSEAVYETLEDSMYALWPLLKATEYGGVLAAKGLVWGVLYTFTMEEDSDDVKGLSFEMARLVREYMPNDQDPDQMPGIIVGDGGMEAMIKESEENPYAARPELGAFMDAALSYQFASAANVTSAVSDRIGRQSYVDRPSYHEDLDAAIKLTSINFLGSVLASLATRFGDLMVEADDEDGK